MLDRLEGFPFRSLFIATIIASASIALAIWGAKTLGGDTGIDGINRFVELLSGRSGAFLGGLVKVSALFAFAAGMAAAVNPCGFALLPAYLGLYLGAGVNTDRRLFRQLGQAVLVGGTVTAGFALLFGLAGTLIGLGVSFVAQALPWFGLSVGVILTIIGAWLASGGKLYAAVAARASSHIGQPGQIGIKGYFLFGVSYGIASLACTLPIFLAVLGVSSVGVGFLNTLINFLLFAAGMGLVITVLTLSLVFFKKAMVGALQRALPYLQSLGAWLMVLAGAYIIFYWLTIGGLL